MKVAAYQAPLDVTGSSEMIGLIRDQIDLCESLGVHILCCPEGVIGGLADYAIRPEEFAFDIETDLPPLAATLSSDEVATIIGFTEIDKTSRLYNAAAIFYRGSVIGIYRKLYPAINRSIYDAGNEMPVFTIGDLTFGIIICNDSNYDEPAEVMTAKGATALFVPTNNGLPLKKTKPESIARAARKSDIDRAIKLDVSVIRADVSGHTKAFSSWGSSGIIASDGKVLRSADPFSTGLIFADIGTAQTEVFAMA
jgi:predicted amidohydrolase